MIETGLQAQRSFIVTADDTAACLGSGDLDVLATPRLLAWCEAVACSTVADEVAADDTTVGTRVSMEHLAASPVGAQVEITATLAYVDGRLLRFEVSAAHTDGYLVGHGEVTRVTVNRERFRSRIS